MILGLLLTMTIWSGDTALIWKESTRDIYIDGRREPEARLYYNSEREAYALTLPGSRKILVIEDSGDRPVVYLAAGKAFHFSDDRLEASSETDYRAARKGVALAIDERQLLFEALGHTLLITRHQGTSGSLSREGLFAVARSWPALVQRYEPQSTALQAFAAVAEPLTLTVYLGTWCGDSRNHVPKLLKTLDLARNPNIALELVAVSSDFSEPWRRLRRDRITNVPTILVTRAGVELGRFVESPERDSVEADLAAIFSGTGAEAGGAGVLAVAGAQLVVEGGFRHSGADGDADTLEHWRWYRREDGGHLLYAALDGDRVSYRLRLRADEARRPTFLEISEERPAGLQRTRYYIGENEITATRRGSDTGIVRLALGYEGRLFLQTPSAFLDGWLRGGEMDATAAVTLLKVDHELARLLPAGAVTESAGVLETSAGKVAARKQELAELDLTWWLDRESGLPIYREAPGGQAELASFRWQRDDGQ